MATLGEQSVLELLAGRPALAGYEGELARPDLWNSPSGNYGPTAELALGLDAESRGDHATIADTAWRWERFLEPGVPGVAMRIEPNSSTYVPWIVCPVDGAFHLLSRFSFGERTVARAHWWLRAWLTMAALAMAPRRGLLIDDETDPPGEARPGPVYARVETDRTPWTGSPYPRRNRGILPSVLVGERAWQRGYAKDSADDYRLCRGYLDQSQHSQIAMLALDLPWQADTGGTGDWPARFLEGIRSHFGAARLLACLTDEERANIRWAWQEKSVDAVERVLPYLAGWLYQQTFTLACLEDGSLWMLAETGGTTSTAPSYGSTWDAASGESAWLACDSGIRKSSGAIDAIVAGRGWEDGDWLRCERSDGRFGTRSLKKPAGAERWRIVSTREDHRLVAPGRPDRLASSPAVQTPPAPLPAAPGAPSPQPAKPSRRRRRGLLGLLAALFGGGR